MTQDSQAFSPAEIDAFYAVAGARRDVRNGFLPDPVDDDVLTRILAAAHQAPSVGLSQPWDFLVLREREIREEVQRLAQAQRDAFAATLPWARALAFSRLKVEAILESPVSIVVTCDATRGGRHVLGRHAQPQVAEYSAVCAVQNLWLAARAESLGVGWVSILDLDRLRAILRIPPHVAPVAYLALGYCSEFPERPELESAGWERREKLARLIHFDGWGGHDEARAAAMLPGEGDER